MPSSVSCDVILDFKGMKYVVCWRLLFVRPTAFLCQEMPVLLKLSSIVTSKIPCDTHSGLVTNRTKFDPSTSVSLGRVKTLTDTHRKNFATLHRFF